MSNDPTPQWLDEQNPHDEAASQQQLHSVFSVLSGISRPGELPLNVLELGCGAGRVLVPMAKAQFNVTGMDNNASALRVCEDQLKREGLTATLCEQDFLAEPWPAGNFDAIMCLGNTLMTIVSLDDAVGLFRTVQQALREGGVFLIDDLPGDFWPELSEGNWQAGTAEDGSAQLIWDPRDAVFTLRTGDQVDLGSWQFKSSDRKFRLWTAGTLNLACRLTGLSEPVVHPGLLAMFRAGNSAAM